MNGNLGGRYLNVNENSGKIKLSPGGLSRIWSFGSVAIVEKEDENFERPVIPSTPSLVDLGLKKQLTDNKIEDAIKNDESLLIIKCLELPNNKGKFFIQTFNQ